MNLLVELITTGIIIGALIATMIELFKIRMSLVGINAKLDYLVSDEPRVYKDENY